MTATAPRPFPLKFYRTLTGVAAPIFDWILKQRIKKGKEDPKRFGERKGEPTLDRPDGPLIWLHGASVGESLVGLTLIGEIQKQNPELNILLTSGTVTSAELLSRRLGNKAQHQFIPVDHPGYVARFLDHWKPDLALWIESEIWPNLIMESAARDIPMALVNARMSDRSFGNWSKRPRTAAALFGQFQTCLATDQATADKLSALGGRSIEVTGNLKLAAAPLPYDKTALSGLQQLLKDRTIWLASSTHKGEESQCAKAHKLVSKTHKDALLIVVPRHPERGPEIASTLKEAGFQIALRSRNQMINAETQIYIADTLGELGVFYRLCDIVFVGGSLVTHGGQNPLEPARLDCAILHGPHTANFDEIYTGMHASSAAMSVENAGALGQAVDTLLQDPAKCANLARAAQQIVAATDHVIDHTIEVLKPLLPGKRD